ncbi:MAG: hypothetical protein IJ867_02545 [Clostridia bacterium]|nr:hypothetical protein [Clostridia bacterium]
MGFLLLSNISFQIPVGIVILTLIVWKIWESHGAETALLQQPKSVKISLIVGILIAIILGAVFYEYRPMETLEKNSGLDYLMSYVYDSFCIFNKEIKYTDSSCLATFISVFPMGLLIGIWYIFKVENKHLEFLIPTVIVSILELILIVANKTIGLLPNYLLVLGFNLLQIEIIIYIFARIEERLFSLTKAAYVALLGLLLFMFMPVPSGLTGNSLNFAYLLFTLEAYLVLNYSDKRFWRLASWVFTVVCLFDFVQGIIVKFV